jgi:hypothetical protein
MIEQTPFLPGLEPEEQSRQTVPTGETVHTYIETSVIDDHRDINRDELERSSDKCSVCGGSGSCNSCEAGRIRTQKYKEQGLVIKLSKKSRRK